jgi:hypothetical protein
MARIDNLNAHTKKTHGGISWQVIVENIINTEDEPKISGVSKAAVSG